MPAQQIKQPLAERMRPANLAGFIGQEHLVGSDAILFRSIQAGNIPSIIFWGPPGTGKTTLAYIISKQLDRPFFSLSAINSGVKDVRDVIAKAEKHLSEPGIIKGNAILFIDEIHRFSKSQQDSLLGAVEKGIVTLIGATTENPSFEVISPLLSRCQVYILKELRKSDLLTLLDRAIKQDEVLRDYEIEIQEHQALLRLSGGDARKLMNLLELVVTSEISEIKKKTEGKPKIKITDDTVMNVAQQKIALYDKGGEKHYDIASAFIKSIRGSDPNAAIYWLARMIKGGEDAKFIARRLVILASEDIGNANPTALVIANNCFQAIDVIGYPESQIILSQTVAYLASSPKSNAAITAIMKANSIVDSTGDLPVPLHIRNAPTKLMKELGYGKGYEYSHEYERSFSPQEYFPDKLSGTKIYDPGNNPREKEFRAFLKLLWGEKYNY